MVLKQRYLFLVLGIVLEVARASGEVHLPPELKLTGGKTIPTRSASTDEDPRIVSRLRDEISEKRGSLKTFRDGASASRDTRKDAILKSLDDKGIDGELGLNKPIRDKRFKSEEENRIGSVMDRSEDMNRLRDVLDRSDDKRGLGDVLERKEDRRQVGSVLRETSVADAYEKNKGLLSKLLNLMGADVGPDPLQDLMDDVNKQADATTEVVDDISAHVKSSLENLLVEKLNVVDAKLGVSQARKGILDAAMENEADRWKAILRSYVKLEKGFSGVKEDIKKFQSNICKPAEFIPPERILASFSGIGASVEFNAGSCEVDLTKEFLDWELVLKCTRPSIKYTKTPPMYVSEHTTASEFRTRECKKERILGEEIEEVLHVFGGEKKFDPEILKVRLGQNLLGIGVNADEQSNPMAQMLSRLLGNRATSLFDKSPREKLSSMDVLSKDGKFGALGKGNLITAAQRTRAKALREKLGSILKNKGSG